jgi:hypothetical protein
MPVTSTLPTRTRNESSTPVAEMLATTHRSSSRARSTRSASSATGPQIHAPAQVAPSALTTSTRRTPREDTGSHTAVAAQIVQEAAVQSPQVEEAVDTSTDSSAFGSILPVVSATLDLLAETKRGVTLSGFVNQIYLHHKFPNYKNGQSAPHRIPVEEVLHYNARELLNKIEPKHHGTDVYAWLQEKSTTPFQPLAIKFSDFPYAFVPRRKKAPRGQNELIDRATANNAGSSLDRETASNDRSESPRAGKGLKMPGRRPKKSSLRLTSSKKRPFSEVESGSDSDASETGLKKSHFFQDGDESMEEAEDINPAHKPENAVRIVIQADKIPSTVPKGHHGAWTCEQDDCDYIVRGADAEDCQARIRAHFEHHEQQDERVQLAITEGTRGHTQIKYAWFPPILLIVHLRDNNPSSVTEAPSAQRISSVPSSLATSRPPQQSSRDHVQRFERNKSLSAPASSQKSSSAARQELSRRSFRRLLEQFRRSPHPVSDTIHKLTAVPQQFARKDQAPRRNAAARGAAPARAQKRRRHAAADQDESDSMTQ